MWSVLAAIAAWFRRFFWRAENMARQQEVEALRISIAGAEERAIAEHMERCAELSEETRRVRRESDRLASERHHGIMSASARVRSMPAPVTRGIQISYPDDD